MSKTSLFSLCLHTYEKRDLIFTKRPIVRAVISVQDGTLRSNFSTKFIDLRTSERLKIYVFTINVKNTKRKQLYKLSIALSYNQNRFVESNDSSTVAFGCKTTIECRPVHPGDRHRAGAIFFFNVFKYICYAILETSIKVRYNG